MSQFLVNDIEIMHTKYKTLNAVSKMDNETLKEFLNFRVSCIEEELNELKQAIKDGDTDSIVDSVIDGLVFGIGLLHIYNVDVIKAWSEVYRANMEKEVGQKSTRPNKYGFPDLIKKSDWVPPSHKDNVGLLSKLF